MKKIILLYIFCFISLSILNAQIPPNAFNYSAVARDVSGQPIATTTVGIRISILKTSTVGQVVYSENHFVNTDAYGLFNLVIGAGAVQSGSMASIDWSNDNYYLKVGMDANGGTNFLTMGTTQLLSVPYALHAATADSIVGGGSGGGNFTHYIGEEYGGGVIFHLWKDAQGVEHGLIVDKTDLSTSHEWSNILIAITDSTHNKFWDGLLNSTTIINQPGHANSAASICLNSLNGGYSDWYLPSIEELLLLVKNWFNVNKTLREIAGANELIKYTDPMNFSSYIRYWSSTEGSNGNNGTAITASTGSINYSYSKSNFAYVRAIRAF